MRLLPSTLWLRKVIAGVRPEAQHVRQYGPWRSGDRIALLRPSLLPERRARSFKAGQAIDIFGYEPDILAGCQRSLLRLTESEAVSRVRPAVTRAVVVISVAGQPLLEDSRRDRLWEVFQAPVYEEIRASDGRLLAAECDAHCGLHIASSAASLSVCPASNELRIGVRESSVFTNSGMTAGIVTDPCPCGSSTPRVTGLRPLQTPATAPGSFAASRQYSPVEAIS